MKGLSKLTAFLGVILSLTIFSLASASVSKQVNHRTHTYSIITSGLDAAYYVNIQAPSPALAVDNLYLKVLTFEYPKPANTGKYDNRVKSFAQNWRSWQVASHYRS